MNRKVKAMLAALGAAGLVSVLVFAGSSSSASAKSSARAAAVPSWCGPKKITLALADGFGTNNWRLVTVGEARAEVALCPNITKFIYTNGEGNTQKAISDINADVASGVNALVDFPDAGPAMLPALTAAYKAGVVTVPYRVTPGGQAGVNYNYFISTDFTGAGVLWGKWLVKALHGKGNVVNLSGPAGNSQGVQEYNGMLSVLKSHPGIKFIGQKPFNVTNWDAAQTQKVVTAILASTPKIDAFTTDYGAAFDSSFAAFKQAGRKIPALATEDSNQLSCDRAKLLKTNPGFKLFTVDSQNWMVRLAVDFAVAKASGGTIPASSVSPQKAFEDSISGVPHKPICDASLPGTAFLSSHLTKAQQRKALKA